MIRKLLLEGDLPGPSQTQFSSLSNAALSVTATCGPHRIAGPSVFPRLYTVE